MDQFHQWLGGFAHRPEPQELTAAARRAEQRERRRAAIS
jgi:hypothetical protein